MIYVNQSKRNAYLKLDQVLENHGMYQIQKEDFNDDEDAKDYELLAKTIKDNTNAYNSKLTQQSQRSQKKNFSNIGKEIVMSSYKDKVNGYENKKVPTEYNQYFVKMWKKAIIFNKDNLSNYRECLKKIDNELCIKKEDEETDEEEDKEMKFNGSNSNKNNIHTSNLSFGKEDISNAETSANPNNIQLNNEETNLNNSNQKTENNQNQKNSNASVTDYITQKQNQLLQNKAHSNEIKRKRKRILQNAIRYLISNGIKVSDFYKNNPFNPRPFFLRNSEEFIHAVKFNNIELVEQALKSNKAYLFEYDYYKQTAYHWAAKLGNKEILQVLLENGKCSNQYDNKMRTPLYFAALNNQLECVNLLLENGGNPQICDIEGKKPVDVTTNEQIRKNIIKAIDKLYGDNKKEIL